MPKMTKQDWLSALSNTLQFILGFLLGVALIAGGAVGAAYYYFKKMSSTVPEKPVYTEESNTTEAASTQATEASNNDSQSDTELTSNAEIELDAETESESTAPEELPPNSYYANVTWPEGLSLRAEPSLDATRIGGIGYDAKILILEDSADKQWQKVRIPGSEQEGWVKAGNIRRASN